VKLRTALLALTVGAAACGSDPSGASEMPGDAEAPDSSPPSRAPDAGAAEDSSPPSPVVAVAHERELRGAWISTVYNGTWPSKTGLTKEAAQAELLALFDALAGAHMNAVFLQVRPESDAFYASTLEPWSRFLTGTQGQSPGWDPLAFAVEQAHVRGLELHAWLNPYRGLASGATMPAANHPTKMLPDRAYPYGTQVWMDPGAPEVRAHIRDVVRDIAMRYDVDGIHFDDYFYPYPVAGATFPDDVTYDAYVAGGGALPVADWRRANVDTLVREVHDLLADVRPDIRFGISPFGIHRPGTPPGIVGLDAYAVLYCDAPRWMHEGWVDYLAPQLYWPTTRTAQAYGKLVTWWSDLAEDGRSIVIGHDLTKLGQEEWPVTELALQVELARVERPKGARGNIFFTAAALRDDRLGIRTALASKFWKTRVTSPPLARAREAEISPPITTVEGKELVVSTAGARVRGFGVYRHEAGAFRLTDFVAPAASDPSRSSARIALGAGTWAVSVVDRRGVESGGARVVVP